MVSVFLQSVQYTNAKVLLLSVLNDVCSIFQSVPLPADIVEISMWPHMWPSLFHPAYGTPLGSFV